MTGRQSLYQVSAVMVKTTQSSQGQQLCQGHSELDIMSTAGWAANSSTTTVLGTMVYWATGGEKKEGFSELLTMQTVVILSRAVLKKTVIPCSVHTRNHSVGEQSRPGYNELKVWIQQSW
jgi:hypothetical protein